MTMTFRYDLVIRQTPSITLGGRWVQPRPIIPLMLAHGHRIWYGKGLLDTGAMDTLFPMRVASQLGLDLSDAPMEPGEGVGQARFDVRYARVTFRVTDNHESREWESWVGFTSVPLRQPLLGFGGFLQYFTATFHGDKEFVELTINALYPGT